MKDTMSRTEFLEYVNEHFNVSGESTRLIDNILHYVELQGVEKTEQQALLHCLLDGSIGLTDEEIAMISL